MIPYVQDVGALNNKEKRKHHRVSIIYASSPFAKPTKVKCLRDEVLSKMKMKLKPYISHASKILK
jgi:hypothetical protein